MVQNFDIEVPAATSRAFFLKEESARGRNADTSTQRLHFLLYFSSPYRARAS
jgi:septin family protein